MRCFVFLYQKKNFTLTFKCPSLVTGVKASETNRKRICEVEQTGVSELGLSLSTPPKLDCFENFVKFLTSFCTKVTDEQIKNNALLIPTA